MNIQRTPEWYSARKGRITGSNAGAALGLNKYKTQADLIRQMVREYHDAPSEFTGNEATDYGTQHELGNHGLCRALRHDTRRSAVCGAS